MTKFNYYFNIDEKVILEAIANHWDYDEWCEVEYSNDKKGVDYNIYIDNSTNKIIFGSAFYKIFKNKNNKWQHDTSQYYPYEINFKDPNWKVNLKNEAKKAYKTLWGKELKGDNTMIKLKEIAMNIYEELKFKSFNDVTDCSSCYIIKKCNNGLDRYVEVNKANIDNKCYYVIYCAYEDGLSDFKYTKDLSLESLIEVLKVFYNETIEGEVN